MSDTRDLTEQLATAAAEGVRAQRGAIEGTGMTTQEDERSNRVLRRVLRAIGTCAEGRDWIGGRDVRTAWEECPRGDWLLWIVERLGVDHRLAVRAAVRCVEPVVAPHMPPGETRPQEAIDAALTWANSPTTENLRTAHGAARLAYGVAFSCEDVAACAAKAAADLIGDPEAAVADAGAIAAADEHAGTVGWRPSVEAGRCHADIVREEIPFPVVAAAFGDVLASMRESPPRRAWPASSLDPSTVSLAPAGRAIASGIRRRALAQSVPAR